MTKRRGSILVAALIVLGLLATLLGALHWYEGLNRQGLERAETALHSRVALRWWEASWIDPTVKPPPEGGDVKLSAQENEELKKAAYALDQPWASAIFEREKLPDFAATPAEGLQTGQTLAVVKARRGLPARPLGSMKVTSSTRFDYAACALQGDVTLGKLRSWANPVDSTKETDQGGGVLPRVYAGTKATLAQADYGEVLVGGDTPPEIKQGQALAFTQAAAPTAPNGRPLQAELGGQCNVAILRLGERNRQDGDKTARVFSHLSIDTLVGYLLGVVEWSTFETYFLSLATATEFPFYDFLTLRVGFGVKPPRITSISVRIHGALIPDTPVLQVIPDSQQSKAPDSPTQEEWSALRGVLQGQLEEIIQQAPRSLSQAPQNSPKVQANPADFRPGKGSYRADEALLKIDWDGQQGVVYIGWLEQLPKLVKVVGLVIQIPPKIKEAIQGLGHPAPVYWFGSERFVSKFEITQAAQPKLTARCTLTVPRGRSFYLKGDLTLEGDIWIQRGASFQIDGNLTTVVPPVGNDWPFQSQGRIILEQGATLVVRDNLEVAGSPRWGSVLVASEDGRAEAITSAILVGGSARFRHGILPALTLEDLVAAVGRNDATTAALQKQLLEPYFDIYAPNISKARGPFWVRKPFFAKWATEADIFPIPVVKPPIDLLLSPNLNCLFSSLATLTEVPFLNAVFGEFMALHSDAWFFGDETVPALLKIPVKPVENMTRAWGSRFQHVRFTAGFEKRLTDLTYEAMMATTQAPQKMMHDAYMELFRQVGFTILPFDPPVADTVYENINKAKKTTTTLRSYLGARDLSDMVHDLTEYLLPLGPAQSQQCPGVLVYSGGEMAIGHLDDSNSVAAGMFVSQGSFTCYSQKLIGSVISFEGQIRCRELWYFPGFTRASLALPGPVPEGNRGALQQITLTKYGKHLNPSPDSILVGVGQKTLNSEMMER